MPPLEAELDDGEMDIDTDEVILSALWMKQQQNTLVWEETDLKFGSLHSPGSIGRQKKSSQNKIHTEVPSAE